MTTTIVEPVEAAFRLPPLVTPEQFAAGTGGKVSAEDPRLVPLLAGASAGIRRYVGWHVAPVLEETVTLDGPGGRLLMLRTGRLLDLLEVRTSGVTLDPAAIEWSQHGMLKLGGGLGWSDRFRGVTVRIRHGYDLADVPDLGQIVQQVTANALASPMGATREQAGQVSISWATTAPGVSGGLSLLERDLDFLSGFKI